jgi:putative transposase
MNTYKRHRFPPDIISYAVWLYHRFNLSHRDIEDLLAERGIIVSYESIRLWCIKFGSEYARRLKRRHQGYGGTFYIDEVFVKINGKQHYLWRAVDQDGEVVDVYLQAKRDGAAAVYNLFNLGSHLISANHYRSLRISAFSEWGRAVA